jgi:hypothetical protein
MALRERHEVNRFGGQLSTIESQTLAVRGS